MTDIVHQIRRARLFHGVSPEVLEPVVRDATRRELNAGDMLLRAGDTNDTVFLILSGAVSVHVTSADQPHVSLGPGECVGELSVIDARRVSATVVAIEPTVVLAFDRSQIWSLIDASADVARNFLGILAGRMRQDDEALVESSRLQLHFENMASIDGLTGLRNRRWLENAFERQMTRTLKAHQPVSLLMIDLDGFKQLNDAYGHQVGDAVLRRTARLLAANLRPQDLLARYGGEEFAVLLPNADAKQAVFVAERLRQAVRGARTEPVEERNPPATISIGVTSAGHKDDVTLRSMIAAADAALYRAKHGGRDRVSL